MLITKELARTLEQAEIDALHSRLTSIRQINKNPMGIELKIFGSATAFTAKNIPGPSFNTVKGLQDGDEKLLDAIINFYQTKEIPLQFELTPGNVSANLLTSLHTAGFYHTDFHTMLAAPLSGEKAPIDPLISIRALSQDEFDLFSDIYVQGFQLPAFLKQDIAKNNQILHGHDHWNFYLASIRNEPAGVGVLFNKNGIATLAAAATIPHLRNKGVQTALIHERLNQAKRLGCTMVTGQAKFGSASQNNMERAGLNIAYTKAIWTAKQ